MSGRLRNLPRLLKSGMAQDIPRRVYPFGKLRACAGRSPDPERSVSGVELATRPLLSLLSSSPCPYQTERHTIEA